MMDKVEVIEELSDITIKDIGTEASGADTSPPKSDKHKEYLKSSRQHDLLRLFVVRMRSTNRSAMDILLKATGNAPIMKKKKWAVDPDKPIGWIIEFIRKYLKLDPADSLFLYVNQSFAPSPDQIVRNLYDCYGTDGKLILHYCKSQAWG
uniref:Ubiquitin-like protein ATG12 n=2 Tax=Timema TaxID=61471 RepID=A0A7R9K6M2_TIMGE|nr:unnamed protein product [Timema genevievae]